MDQQISVCGLDCSQCYCFGEMCQGCNACDGKVFHAPEGKACSIYECVRNGHKLSDCGKCEEVPCEIWLKTRDPKYSDKEFEDSINMRIQNLKKTGES